MEETRLVISTFPNLNVARQIGTLAVENQAIACVNLIPSVESIYRWNDQIETATEVLAIFKTTVSAYPDFSKWLEDIHPYDTPEILAISPNDVMPKYKTWLSQCVAKQDS